MEDLDLKNGRDRAGLSSVCLVVDDEPAILRLISVALEDLGCETLAAPNAEAALELLQEMTPNLVIADLPPLSVPLIITVLPPSTT